MKNLILFVICLWAGGAFGGDAAPGQNSQQAQILERLNIVEKTLINILKEQFNTQAINGSNESLRTAVELIDDLDSPYLDSDTIKDLERLVDTFISFREDTTEEDIIYLERRLKRLVHNIKMDKEDYEDQKRFEERMEKEKRLKAKKDIEDQIWIRVEEASPGIHRYLALLDEPKGLTVRPTDNYEITVGHKDFFCMGIGILPCWKNGVKVTLKDKIYFYLGCKGNDPGDECYELKEQWNLALQLGRTLVFKTKVVRNPVNTVGHNLGDAEYISPYRELTDHPVVAAKQ